MGKLADKLGFLNVLGHFIPGIIVVMLIVRFWMGEGRPEEIESLLHPAFLVAAAVVAYPLGLLVSLLGYGLERLSIRAYRLVSAPYKWLFFEPYEIPDRPAWLKEAVAKRLASMLGINLTAANKPDTNEPISASAAAER